MALKPTDLKEVSTFDTAQWTHDIAEMPLSTLKAICDGGQYKHSVGRVRKLCAAMKKVFVEKDELIDLMSWCAVAGLPMLMLGRWGTGKSMLVRQFSAGLGIRARERRIDTEEEVLAQLAALSGIADRSERFARGRDVLQGKSLGRTDNLTRHFEYLVTRFTTPEELLGPVNIDLLLSHAIHMRQTRSLMPRAEVVFLDEVFKANSAILNALLSLIHERIFYNAGIAWSVNLIMLFAASNEPPQEEELGAFFDRFPVRALCSPVPKEKLEDLLTRSHSQTYLSLLPSNPSAEDLNEVNQTAGLSERRMSQQACVNDFRLLRKVCLYRQGGAALHDGTADSKKFLAQFLRIFANLRDGYDVSDRSFGHFYRLARARALLVEGRPDDRLMPEDCSVMQYCGRDTETALALPGIVNSLLA